MQRPLLLAGMTATATNLTVASHSKHSRIEFA